MPGKRLISAPFEPIIRDIAIWNKNHMAVPELGCMARVRSMPGAQLFNDSEYLHRRAEEARAHAKQMSNERHKEMMLELANEYDDLAVEAARRAMDETKGS
jgi:hypothetical protein